jgi:hypothetical protein
MANSDQERFVRWQAITREQLSFANNLLLGLAVAVVGFEISLTLNDKFALVSCWQKTAFLVSLALLAASSLAALVAVVTRLCDFRLTARTIRTEQTEEQQQADHLRAVTAKLGSATWNLFWLQIATFFFGILLAVVAVGGFVVSRIAA